MLRKELILTGKPFTDIEKVLTTICADDTEAARYVASLIARTIHRNRERGESTVLGLATGNTPVGVYRELVRMHHEEDLDFSQVTTFNLDEYYPMDPGRIQSYHRWMHENFFDQVNIPAKNIHIPDGSIPESEVAAHCQAYEESIAGSGGIDIQLLGIGRTGHIGFNEPGSSRESATRLIQLDPVTRRDAAADFFGEANVPGRAITMGVGTILRARRVVLMALGEQKAPIIRRAVEGEVTDAVAASFLQQHRQAEVVVDRAAAADLTRVNTPWVLGEIEWSEENQHRAVIWLSLETDKSILKLSQEDYEWHHLASLLQQKGPIDELNVKVARRLFETIVRHGTLPTGKRVLCFSPHPDDDVISMGGTLNKLVRAGNQVHVAYMTSGNIAVFDDDARMMLNFWADLNLAFGVDTKQTRAVVEKVKGFFAVKPPGGVDIPEVQEIKTWIRRNEAASACRLMGIPRDNTHHLNLPFYRTGEVRKRPISEDDVQIVLDPIRRIRPDWIFVAGEMSDPHGTHRVCAEAVFAALKGLKKHDRPEAVWLYRGAWQEWEPDVIDMAIPLSKGELTHKIFAIFKHQSQKDKALFPGPYDDREFWQRAEARNTQTAALYDKLGLPEFHAMEAFARHEDY